MSSLKPLKNHTNQTDFYLRSSFKGIKAHFFNWILFSLYRAMMTWNLCELQIKVCRTQYIQPKHVNSSTVCQRNKHTNIRHRDTPCGQTKPRTRCKYEKKSLPFTLCRDFWSLLRDFCMTLNSYSAMGWSCDGDMSRNDKHTQWNT